MFLNVFNMSYRLLASTLDNTPQGNEVSDVCGKLKRKWTPMRKYFCILDGVDSLKA